MEKFRNVTKPPAEGIPTHGQPSGCGSEGKRMRQLTPASGVAIVQAEPQVSGEKYRVPQPGAAILPRRRLTDLLDQAVTRPVTLVTAPVGAGKTVACANWAAARARTGRVAWLSLDEGDREAPRFWASVASALAVGGAAPLPFVPRGRDAADGLATDAVQAMRKPSASVTFVIDDVQVLEDSDVLSGLAFLLQHVPPALHFVLSGRCVPVMHLAKIRVASGLSEIGAADLACTSEEADAYFAEVGLSCDPAVRDELLWNTEGWMTGLRLAALIGQRDAVLSASAIGTDPIVADYMRDEVLDHQPAVVREFLCRTSVAERLTGDFADYLTGASGGAQILDRLDRRNSFVSRDGDGAYRCHPLLRDALHGELRRQLPREVPALLGRAARWYGTHQEALTALRYCAEACDWDYFSQVLTDVGYAEALPDQLAELEAVLGLVPEDRRSADPAVTIALATVRSCRGDAESAEAYLRRAEETLDATDPAARLVVELSIAASHVLHHPDDEVLTRGLTLADKVAATARTQPEHRVLGLLWLELGKALLCRREIVAARHALASAERQLAAADRPRLRLRARGWQAVADVFYGDLGGAAVILEELRDAVAPYPGARCFTAIAAVHLALEQDDLALATRLLNQVDPAAVTWLPGEPDGGTLWMLTKARAALAGGDVAGARDLARLVRDKHAMDTPLVRALDADIALHCGDLPVAAVALGGAGGERPAGDLAARARLLLAGGDSAAAVEKARACLRADDATLRDRITALLTAALASRRLGESGEATALLEDALVTAEPHDAFRPFLDAGGAAHSAIAILIPPASPAASFAARVRERFARRLPAGMPDSEQLGHADQPLTQSEIAVLRLLGSHLTNQEIAAALFISVNTVKTHLRSAYRKLGVTSRRQAVERGRQRGIL
jgi:LuxR family maltose regulon positive regulatory protein